MVELDGTSGQLLRVGASQFGVGTEVQKNLERCLSAIDEAAEAGVHVLVLPEFCNHAAWYDSQHHAWSVAVSIDGPFLSAVAERTARHHMYVQCNVSRRTSAAEDDDLRSSNVLFGPDGFVALSDKTVLMGNENNYFKRGLEPNPVIDLPFGRVGLYACMEGVVCEPARHLAVRGATLLLNSLNSFATDEASLHVPVRAAENGVFIVAACKVGPLVPKELLENVAGALQIPSSRLRGAGESQIVNPLGVVLAIAPADGEKLVFADLDLREATRFARPDGTDVWQARRPNLYRSLARNPATDALLPPAVDELAVAVVIPSTPNLTATVEEVSSALVQGAQLIVLPELCGHDPISAVSVDWAHVVHMLTNALAKSSGKANSVHVVTSIIEGGAHVGSHVGIVISGEGIIHRQLQLHTAKRLPWMNQLGDECMTIDLPWGRLGLVVGDDLAYPEVARVFATLGVQVLACPISLQSKWEASLGLPERCAENRINLVAASQTQGLIGSLPTGMTLWADRAERPFDGSINMPNLTWADTGSTVTMGVVRPANAANKMISRGTDLVGGRPYSICAPIVDVPLVSTDR